MRAWTGGVEERKESTCENRIEKRARIEDNLVSSLLTRQKAKRENERREDLVNNLRVLEVHKTNTKRV